jgi:hypothetical protein
MVSTSLELMSMARRKSNNKPKPQSSSFRDPHGRVWPVSARYQEDGSVYLYVPRDARYWSWHKPYWVGIPEWARHKDYATGLHWVSASYAASAVSVLVAYYPECVIVSA